MHDLLWTSQELVNLEAIRTLRLYHTEFQALHTAPVSASTGGCTPELQRGYTPELQQVEALMARVEQTVGHSPRQTHWRHLVAPWQPPPQPSLAVQVLTSHAEINTEIIARSEELTRRLRGVRTTHRDSPVGRPCTSRTHAVAVCMQVRITSCKSAKDRTSMAVTAEQARLLVERHGLHEAEAAELADEMRRRGVRWQNMRKNVSGPGQYAFNWLQQRLLPEIYRAPSGTYTRFGGVAT